MKMTNSRWICVIVLLVLVVSFSIVVNAEQKDKLIVIGHKVHQQVAEGTDPSINMFKDFMEENNLSEIEWITYDTAKLHEKLFRESSLSETNVDVGYCVNFYSGPKIVNLFEPLNKLMKDSPIEKFNDFPLGMVNALTFDNKLYGIPIRSAISALHINKAIFEERGVKIPQTIEELFEAARKLTYTKDNGQKVYGLVIFGEVETICDPVLGFARAWPNVDYITSEYKVTTDKEPIVKAIKNLADLYKEGVLPPETLSLTINDSISYFKSGRAAMTFGASGYYKSFNDPIISSIAGNAEIYPLPASKDAPDTMEIADGLVNFWSMVIPHGVKDKQLSWKFIKYVSSEEFQLKMAMNGNEPTRLSLYDTPEYIENTPYAEVVKKILGCGRVPWPAFPGVEKAMNVFGNEVQMAILGKKSPEQAMKDATKKIEEIIPEDLK